MVLLRAECKNTHCSNNFQVEFSNTDFRPILFCSETCLYTFESEKLIPKLDYEDPTDIKNLVHNLIDQTKQLQVEIESLKKIKKAYFGLFKDNQLKDETYKREWSFDKTVDK